MRILVTGSQGHLGEALVRVLRDTGHEVIGLDVLDSPYTTVVGSILDRSLVRHCMDSVSSVLHTAALHKPHIMTHSRQEFVDTNVGGTLNLLEAAVRARVGAFIFTSTTSVFGDASRPPHGAPAAWITEDVAPIPRNIYGVTKAAAEDICELTHHEHGLPCLTLRTARFFPDEDDRKAVRESYEDSNIKANEFLYRRVELHDVVDAHLLAIERAAEIGSGRFIISATSPFEPDELVDLRIDAPAVLERHFPDYARAYSQRGWKMFPSISRIYANERARRELGWQPRYDFRLVLDRLQAQQDPRSALAVAVGSKGYHEQAFADGLYPVK